MVLNFALLCAQVFNHWVTDAVDTASINNIVVEQPGKKKATEAAF
jgi:hypothetical protein